jgi:hypothetical protein
MTDATNVPFSIAEAHCRLAGIIGPDKIEPLAAAATVESLRQAWRPSTVRVLLLAESHVWTSAEEGACRVRIAGLDETGFARFVYCVGYGERSLADVTGNRGTPQYWKLFHDCIDGPDVSFDYLTRKETSDRRRIEARLRLLNRMREAGLWLVDASVTALYHNGRRLAVGKAYREALEASWDAHVGQIVKESEPEAVVIVGKGVWKALSSRIEAVIDDPERIMVIHQPQARISALDRLEERRRCFEFCSKYLRPLSGTADAAFVIAKPTVKTGAIELPPAEAGLGAGVNSKPAGASVKTHNGATPKPLKGERSGQFIQRVILKGLWKGNDAALAKVVVEHYPGQVTTQKDVAWNRWKLRKTGLLLKHQRPSPGAAPAEPNGAPA